MRAEEGFSEEQINILKKYVTNTSKNIFVLKNLPEVIKGALFSKYSRSPLGLRELLLKEFLNENQSGESVCENDLVETQKAQDFYDKILDGYGDDSIGELGGAHLAIENVSMIAAKAIEDCRIGGSPLEKSTRYICFDQKINDDYRFYKEPILMTSAFKDIYLNTCRNLFDTYARLIPPVTELIEKNFPQKEGISPGAFKAALRAKVLDCIRGILPASTLTNLGVFGNGRFFENLIKKLSCHNLVEMQDVGKTAFNELTGVIPSFVKRSDNNNKCQMEYSKFIENTKQNLKCLSREYVDDSVNNASGVSLINYNPDDLYKVCAALLFDYSENDLKSIQSMCRNLPKEEILRIFESVASLRENRRHKSPRALENADFTFEIVADFGIYRDLQRHRMLTQERQLLSCNLGYYIPHELVGTPMQKDYVNAMNCARDAYEMISKEFPEEAQYVVPMAYNLRWYFKLNLRALQWLCELRSSAAGHSGYRLVAQNMVKQVCSAIPEFTNFFKFVDFQSYDLGRMKQEINREEKIAARSNV
ncbi:MAG: FAD-dependent thymidylate synthase [Parachlamydiales bacterium]|jgi:thymidylate synthase ThyX